VVAAASLAVLNQVHAFGFQFNTTWLLVLVCGSLIFNTINQTAIPSLNLLEFRGWFVTLTLATIAAGLLSSYLLVRNFSATAEYWLLGLLIGQTIFAVAGVKLFFDRLRPSGVASQPTKDHLGVLFGFAWPVAISVGFNWLQTQGYRFLVADSLGLVSLGLFVVGYGISAGLMAAFESVLTTYFQPHFYKAVSKNDHREQARAWNKYASAILPSLMLVIFILTGLASELTRFMVGPAYQSASQYVVWGVLSEGARVAAGVYSMSAHARMRTNLLVLPNLIGASVCIGFIWAFTHRFGVHSVGFARVLAGVAIVVAMHYLMVKVLEMKLPYRMLLRSISMGLGLLLIATVGRWLLGATQNLWVAGGLIIVTGLAFLPMFYWLIFPFLPRHDKA
jgi:O-antigen/teichoic acid export membrane protein